jgi:hypothetical protein
LLPLLHAPEQHVAPVTQAAPKLLNPEVQQAEHPLPLQRALAWHTSPTEHSLVAVQAWPEPVHAVPEQVPPQQLPDAQAAFDAQADPLQAPAEQMPAQQLRPAPHTAAPPQA